MSKIMMALLALGLTVAPAFAKETGSSLGVGVVDVVRVRQEAKASKAISSQLKSKRDAYQKEIDTEGAALKKAESELRAQRTTLEPAAFEKRMVEFTGRIDKSREAASARLRALDKGAQQAIDQVDKALQEVTADLAAKNKLALVLDKGVTLAVENSMDLTDDVIKALNAKLPNVQVNFPSLKD